MGKFYIDVEKMSKTSKRFDTVGDSVRNAKRTVDSICSRLDGIGLGEMRDPLQKLEAELNNNIKRIDSLSSTLKQVMIKYALTELEVSNYSTQANENGIEWHDVIHRAEYKKGNGLLIGGDGTRTRIQIIDRDKRADSGATYKIGKPERPPYLDTEEKAFAYNPEAGGPTPAVWGLGYILNLISQLGDDPFAYALIGMPDALKAYHHYWDGNGEDLQIDLQKAYNDDRHIRQGIDNYVNELQCIVDKMIKDGQKPPFSVTGTGFPVAEKYYPYTDNWGKTFGGYQMWLSADVSVDADGNIVMDTTIHEQDLYNFNKGQEDVYFHIKDELNGQYEILGLANSYMTYGEMDKQLVWKPGTAERYEY